MSLTLEFDDHTHGFDLGRTGNILLAMAETGASREVLATLLNFATNGKLHPDHHRFLSGPVIQHPSRWRDMTPPWLYKGIGYDRLKIVLEEIKTGESPGWQVGPVELTTLIYPATHDAPIRHEYAQIYLWAAAKANAWHYKKDLSAIWETVGQPVQDEDILKTTGRYHYTYKEICTDVRRKVVSLGKAQERITKQESSREKKPKPPKGDDPQLTLF